MIFSDMWKLCEIQVLVSIWKALLAHGHTRSFMDCLWPLQPPRAELGSCDKGYVTRLQTLRYLLASTRQKVCGPLQNAQYSAW